MRIASTTGLIDWPAPKPQAGVGPASASSPDRTARSLERPIWSHGKRAFVRRARRRGEVRALRCVFSHRLRNRRRCVGSDGEPVPSGLFSSGFDGAPRLDKGELRPDLSRPGLGLSFKRPDAEKFRAGA